MTDRVYHLIEGYTDEDGSIRVYLATNDETDHGYPSEHAIWESKCSSKDNFLKRYGKSGTGCMGAKIIVKLDDVKI